MNIKKQINLMISKILTAALIFTLLPTPVWADTARAQERSGRSGQATPSDIETDDESTPSDTEPECICAGICTDYNVNENCPVCAGNYEDCSGEGQLRSDNIAATPLATDSMPYEEVSLDGRVFSMIASVGEPPYYQVFKFTTPDNGGGYYTFYTEYTDDMIDSVGYLCTPEQYEALCREIENYQCAYIWPEESECIAYNDDGGSGFNFYINHELEEGTDYYFIGTRYYYDEYGDYKLIFMRDIEIDLDHSDADTAGTPVIYSKGDLWCSDRDRTQLISEIVRPQKEGYIFSGYYTEEDGQGLKVIDENGEFLDEIVNLALNETVYALWETFPEISNEYLINGTKGTAYYEKLETDSRRTFYWAIQEGELPAGLSIDAETGVISGIPTETGAKKFTVSAYSVPELLLTREYTIVITEADTASEDGDDYGEWVPDRGGNWRYQTSSSRYYSNEWKQVEDQGTIHWYHFGSEGYIDTGWLRDGSGSWYYLNPASDGTKGAMQTGWLTDPQDGNRYYLDPQTGQMVTGWVYIDGVWYYFNEAGAGASGWRWDESAEAWLYENQGERPLGSLEPGKKREE